MCDCQTGSRSNFLYRSLYMLLTLSTLTQYSKALTVNYPQQLCDENVRYYIKDSASTYRFKAYKGCNIYLEWEDIYTRWANQVTVTIEGACKDDMPGVHSFERPEGCNSITGLKPNEAVVQHYRDLQFHRNYYVHELSFRKINLYKPSEGTYKFEQFRVTAQNTSVVYFQITTPEKPTTTTQGWTTTTQGWTSTTNEPMNDDQEALITLAVFIGTIIATMACYVYVYMRAIRKCCARLNRKLRLPAARAQSGRTTLEPVEISAPLESLTAPIFPVVDLLDQPLESVEPPTYASVIEPPTYASVIEPPTYASVITKSPYDPPQSDLPPSYV